MSGFVGRWIGFVAAGEAAGFAVAAVAGVTLAATAAPPAVSLPVAVTAGALEGAAYSAGQYAAMRGGRPSRLGWLAAGAIGAAVAWSIGMLPSAIGLDPGLPATWVAVGAGGLLLLAAIPVAQWLVLRRAHRRAGAWIPVSMAAWAVGVAWTAAPSPFIDESSPIGLVIGLYVLAGVLMALTVGALTAPLARRLFGEADAAS